MTLDYSGAGDGQCLALKANGERCTNGVYGSNHCCGTHKNASNVTLAPDEDDRDWYYCDECGWQPADWEQGGGSPPYCPDCGVEFGGPLQKWGRDNERAMTEREREIVSGEADDITDEYRYQTVSRIRSRFERLEDDLEALDAHGDLGNELRDIVCDGDE